jgi:hypothetical protein
VPDRAATGGLVAGPCRKRGDHRGRNRQAIRRPRGPAYPGRLRRSLQANQPGVARDLGSLDAGRTQDAAHRVGGSLGCGRLGGNSIDGGSVGAVPRTRARRLAGGARLAVF